MSDGLPENKTEARKWVRKHWASVIRNADMGDVAELNNDHLDAVWSDECIRISVRLAPDDYPTK